MKLEFRAVRVRLATLVLRYSLLLTLLTVCALGSAKAQEGGGIITGNVDDQTGAAIVGAAVNITNPERKESIELKTNKDGSFTTPSLPIGNYEVTVTAEGFQPARREQIDLHVDAHLQVNFKLATGSVSETVQVSSESIQVNVSSSELGTAIPSRPIQQLPVNGRSVLALTQLTPGVTSNAGQVTEGFADRGGEVSSISINGSPNGTNAMMIDGQSIVQDYTGEVSLNPAANAIQEFKIETGTMSAEYGYTAGGVVSMVTASGTSKYHGQVYEFLRNDAFDARNYFNAHPLPVDELRYNQFGGSFGGPLWSKTTIFGNFEEYRYLDGSQIIASVPTDAFKAGDFSQLRTAANKLIPIYDPATTQPNPNGNGYVRTAFKGNIIPQDRIDPVAKKINAFFPEPNCTQNPLYNPYTQANNYCGPAADHISMVQFLVRGDHTFSPRHSMFVRYMYYVMNNDNGGGIYSIIQPFLGGRNDKYPNQAALIEDTFVISPTWLNEVRLSLLRTNFTFQSSSYGGNWPSKLGMPNTPDTTFPRMSNGFPTSSTSTSGRRAATNPILSDIMTLARGRHSLRFGGEVRLNRGYNVQASEPSGIYTFNAALTGNPQSATGTGYAFASYQLGAVASAKVDTVDDEREANFAISGFVQDAWKLMPRLTLNLGVRYDFQQYPYDLKNGLSNFDINATDPHGLRGALVFAGVNGVPRAPRQSDPTNAAPRVGFAWDIFGTGKTSLRGGYGIYYPSIFATYYFGSTSGFAQTVTSYTGPGGSTYYPAMYLKDGLPSPPIQPVGTALGPDGLLGQNASYTKYTDGVTPMSQQWNLAWEQQLPSGIIMTIGYTGNHGVHMMAGSPNLNQLDPKYLALGTALQNQVTNPYAGMVPGSLGAAKITKQQSLLPFPYYGSTVYLYRPHDGNFISHALQVSATKRATNGLTFILAYTKSKLIDGGILAPSAIVGAEQDDITGYQNSYDLSAERAIDPLDRSQNLHVSAVYDLPFGHNHWLGAHAGPIVNRFIGGWQLNTINQWHTGTPLTISGANNYAASRPNFIPGVNVKLSHPSITEWFNTKAFINPPNYTFGNVPRTLPNVRGPSAFNSDISLVKTTTLTERLQSELRIEAFNALNHPVFGLPDMAFSPGSDGMNQSGTFGTITAATDGRELQFALKLLF